MDLTLGSHIYYDLGKHVWFYIRAVLLYTLDNNFQNDIFAFRALKIIFMKRCIDSQSLCTEDGYA